MGVADQAAAVERRVNKTCLGLLALVLLSAASAKATAQQDSGYVGPLAANADDLNGVLPTINQPQPGWTPVTDLKSSDGTATVPPCNDPLVLATVKDGILNTSNAQWPQAGGYPIVSKVTFSTVWVHPTYANSTVCDVQVQLDVQGTGPEEWEFQAFATNGQVKVFFYDKNDQPDQGN